MRLHRFWVVTDATSESTLGDVMFETTLAGFFNQIRGGLTIDHHPAIFTERDEAESEVRRRMDAASRHERDE